MDDDDILMCNITNPYLRRRRRNILVQRLKNNFQESKNSQKIKVALVRGLVIENNTESLVSSHEIGRAVKIAFPAVKRKRIHSCWYYCGIQKIIEENSKAEYWQDALAGNLVPTSAHEMEIEKSKLQNEGRDVQSKLLSKPYRIPSLNLCQEDLVYNEEHVIGEGTFGRCFSGTYKGLPAAIKMFKGQTSFKHVHREADILTKIPSHPNISMLIGVLTEKQPFSLVTKLCISGGSPKTLSAVLKEQVLDNTLSIEFFIPIMFGITSGILHVHNQGILHTDIKSNNVVIEGSHGKLCPVLIDFGKAILIRESKASLQKRYLSSSERDSYRQKYPHVAPEIVLGKPHSVTSDAYSFGYIFCSTLKILKRKGKLGEYEQQLLKLGQNITHFNPKNRLCLGNLSDILKGMLS